MDHQDRPGDDTSSAETRTDLAEDRNIMAVERTYAGWLRTSFAAIGIGLAFRALFGALEPPWLAKAIATLFIVAGAWLALNAQQRACASLERLDAHSFEPISRPKFRLLSWSVAAGAAVLVAGLWVVSDGALNPD